MAQLTFEEFEKFNKKEDRNQPQRANIKYFALKNDNDTAIVRFNIHDLSDITVQSVHNIEMKDGANTRYGTVSCLRESFNDSTDKCPLCKAGNKVTFKVFIPLVSYNEDENGNTVAEAMVWQQGVRIRQTLKSFIEDYGDLSNMLFKITRHGVKGDVNTTYTILPANPNVYKDSVYVKDFSQFENNPKYLDRFIHERSYEDLETFVATGSMPNPYEKNSTKSSEVSTEKTDYGQETYNTSREQSNETAVIARNNLSSSQPLRGSFDNKQSTSPTPVRRYTY